MIQNTSKLVYYQRMQNNYQRLFDELAELVDNRQVYQSLDQNLKIRVDNLIASNYKASIDETIRQLSINDTQTLFTKNNFSYCEPYCESLILKDTTNSNHPKRKQTLNSSGKITAKKIQVSAFDDKKEIKQTKSKNRSLSKVKNQSKSSKDLIRYNMQTSKSKQKSKSKEKVRRGLVQNGSKKAIGHKPVQRDIQKSIENIRLIDRQQKSIKNTFEFYGDNKSQKQSNLKTQQSSILFQSKLKTAASNLCDSRQILKKIIETEPSSANKRQNTREKRIVNKIPDKQITMMQAINKKLQILSKQKRQYEANFSALQELIEKQKARVQSINANIAKMNAQISQKQNHQRSCSQQIKISRKKSEHFISQSRKIQQRLVQVGKSKDTITASIEQEKYLINMYLTVIQEIKSQLKIEQTQKIQLIKKLVLIKNTQKMIMEKYLSKQSMSDHIFVTMNNSMKKWI